MDRTRIYSAATAGGWKAACDDLAQGWKMRPVWRTFAWDEIQSRYRRSALGLIWIVVSYLLFVGGIFIFFGSFAADSGFSYLHYIAIGYPVFAFLVGCLSEGCGVFRGSASWLQSSSMPYSVYVFKSVARSTFPFLLQFGVALAVMLASGWLPTMNSLLALPGLALVFAAAIPLQMILGFLGARSRDVQHLIASVQRLLIFVTPVIWVYDQTDGLRRLLALANPLTHYMELVRSPILGRVPPTESLIAVPVLTAALWLAALLVSARMRRQLPFWV